MRTLKAITIVGLGAISILGPMTSHAWGDEGHMVVGLIADHYLDPAVRQKVNALLAGDSTHLTPSNDISTEATWADKYRDSDRNTTHVRYNKTHEWHFVDIELDDDNIDTACFGHTALPSGTVASDGPPKTCVVDKIKQFSAELSSPSSSDDEKRLALQFLLHFVGDVHQPLHSSDDHDQGGNGKKVKADGVATGSLHHYWDAEFVKKLGSSQSQVAQRLINSITPGQITAWSKGDATSWAKQSYEASKIYVYRDLGTETDGKYTLSAAYVKNATNATARQLSRAGVRLAHVLNEALR